MSKVLTLTLNGRDREDAVADNVLLLDYLREVVGLTGTKTCCDGGECGACTVLVDDQPVLSCLCLANAFDGRRIETIEALPGTAGWRPFSRDSTRSSGPSAGSARRA